MTTEQLKKKYDHLWRGDVIQSGDWIEYVELEDIQNIIKNEVKENKEIHSVMQINKLKPNEVIVDKEYLKKLENFYNIDHSKIKKI